MITSDEPRRGTRVTRVTKHRRGVATILSQDHEVEFFHHRSQFWRFIRDWRSVEKTALRWPQRNADGSAQIIYNGILNILT